METFLTIFSTILVISASMLLGVQISYRVQKLQLPRWASIWLTIQTIAIVSLTLIHVLLWAFS